MALLNVVLPSAICFLALSINERRLTFFPESLSNSSVKVSEIVEGDLVITAPFFGDEETKAVCAYALLGAKNMTRSRAPKMRFIHGKVIAARDIKDPSGRKP